MAFPNETNQDAGLKPWPTRIIYHKGWGFRLLGKPKDPLWIAGDVCQALGLGKDIATFTQGFDWWTEGGYDRLIWSDAGTARKIVVTAAGVRRLICVAGTRSPFGFFPAFMKFLNWFECEALPSIREHGTYPPPEKPAAPVPLDEFALEIYAQAARFLRSDCRGMKTVAQVRIILHAAHTILQRETNCEKTFGEVEERFRQFVKETD